jgi:hypothetical protein
MMRHKAIIAGLALAVAGFSPAFALAKARGIDRPVRGALAGTVSLNLQTGVFTGDVTGVVSHLGRSTAHLDGSGAFTPEATFAGTGTLTTVAANGDRLNGTITLTTSPFTSTGHTTTLVETITGGTGRFADASGTLTETSDISTISFDGVTLVSSVEGGPITGHISY